MRIGLRDLLVLPVVVAVFGALLAGRKPLARKTPAGGSSRLLSATAPEQAAQWQV